MTLAAGVLAMVLMIRGRFILMFMMVCFFDGVLRIGVRGRIREAQTREFCCFRRNEAEQNNKNDKNVLHPQMLILTFGLINPRIRDNRNLSEDLPAGCSVWHSPDNANGHEDDLCGSQRGECFAGPQYSGENPSGDGNMNKAHS